MSRVTLSISHTGLGLREGLTIRRGLGRLGVGFFTQPSKYFPYIYVIFTINLSSLPTTLPGIKTIVSYQLCDLYCLIEVRILSHGSPGLELEK